MHKPYATSECKIMLVEPRGVVNTGEEESELTSENDVWIWSIAEKRGTLWIQLMEEFQAILRWALLCLDFCTLPEGKYLGNHSFDRFPFFYLAYSEPRYLGIYILDSARVPSWFELFEAGFHTLRKFWETADGLAKTANYRSFCSRDYDNLYCLRNPAWES